MTDCLLSESYFVCYESLLYLNLTHVKYQQYRADQLPIFNFFF